jgi:quercetin dioxygenase-like cupin family protein
MEVYRYNPDVAEPLPEGKHASVMPVRINGQLAAMIIRLGPRGDTGMREVGADIIAAVIAGEGQMRSGGMVAEVHPGDVVLLPAHIRHTIWTTSSEMQVVLTLLKSGAG